MTKKKKIKFKDIQPYLKTSFITMLIVSVLSIIFLVCDTKNYITIKSQDFRKNIDKNLILYTIENIESVPENLSNPTELLHLGILYEMLYLYDKAEQYYIKAIEFSNNSLIEAYWNLANVQIKQDKLEIANETLSKVKDKNKKFLKYQKGILYRELAIKYSKKSDFDEAEKNILKSLSYLSKTHKTEYINSQSAFILIMIEKSKFLSSQGNVKQAISEIEKALKMCKSNELLYRLAVLYSDFDLKKSLKYFEEVKIKAPALINYDLYYDVLNKIYENQNLSDIEKQTFLRKMYNLEVFVNKNFVHNNDFSVTDIQLEKKSKFLGLNKNNFITFNLQNNSDYIVNNLWAEIVFYTDADTIQTQHKIITYDSKLLPHSKKVKIEINIGKNKDLKDLKHYKGNIYLYKSKKFNKMEVARFNLK